MCRQVGWSRPCILNATVLSRESVISVLGGFCALFFAAGVQGAHFYGSTYVEQALVHCILPEDGLHEISVIMIPGKNLSSYIFVTTPDGREGWAQRFAEAGFDVYVINSPDFDFLTGGFGVSPFYVPKEGAPPMDPSSTQRWQNDVWKRWGFGSSQGMPYSDTRFPSDQFAAFESNYPHVSEAGRSYSDAILALLEAVGPSVLLGHSAGAASAVQAAKQCPDLVVGFVMVEPAGPPDGNDFPALAGMSMYGVYGDYMDSRSQDGRKEATEAAAVLFRQNGGFGQVVSLPEDLAIFGNTHLMMQDNNNNVIADMIIRWIDENLFSAASFAATELLGRPTDHSVTVNLLASVDLEAYFEYGTAPGVYSVQTAPRTFAGGDPIEVVMDHLIPDTRYYYRMRYRKPGFSEYHLGEEHTFHTQRLPGSAFTFTIQADAHNYRSDSNELGVYSRTLSNILADAPDFHLDLGDTFDMDSVDSAGEARTAYLEQRPYFDTICHSCPFFFVLGNHENEEGWHRDGTADNKAIWSANARKLYYPNPIPDGFYTGNLRVEAFVEGDGLVEDYYAWEWGDALFVVLDPYWYTTTSPYDDDLEKDNWRWTLGHDQYQWLRQTLEGNTRQFTFVFAHQLTGGVNTYGRGGVEAAPYYEWGGRNEDGTWGFDENRPAWETPIHQLMVDSDVDIFFHGHDHIFVKQELDGIVYQEVPTPSEAAGHGDPNHDGLLYGTGHLNHGADYVSGDIVENSGHLRVSVFPSQVIVEYVRAFLPGDGINGEVAYTYTIGGVSARPHIASINPSSPKPDEMINILGSGFGDRQGASVVHLGLQNGVDIDVTSPNVTLWSDSEIVVALPFASEECSWFKHGDGAYRTRKVWLTVDGMDSNVRVIRVLRPEICANP